MSSESADSGSNLIGIKRCPKCKTIITSSFRYGNIIKKHFKDVAQIREKIFGNNQKQKKTQEIIAKKIKRQSDRDWQFEDVKTFLETKLFVMKQSKTKYCRDIELHLLDVSVFNPYTSFLSIHIMKTGGSIHFSKFTQYRNLVGRGRRAL